MLKSIHFVKFFNDKYLGKDSTVSTIKTNRRERQSRKMFSSAKNENKEK